MLERTSEFKNMPQTLKSLMSERFSSSPEAFKKAVGKIYGIYC